MKRTTVRTYEYADRGIYRLHLNEYIDHLESENKELVEEIKRLKKDLKFRRSILSDNAQDS